jgi:hypothetical protein
MRTQAVGKNTPPTRRESERRLRKSSTCAQNAYVELALNQYWAPIIDFTLLIGIPLAWSWWSASSGAQAVRRKSNQWA